MKSKLEAPALHPQVRHRALVIDGDPLEAHSFADALRKGGFGVEIAPTGQIGLDRALAHHLDVIVLDIELPDVDGLLLIQKFRTSTIATPIVVRSGLDFLSVKLRALEIGADDYVTKAIGQQELLARIANLMRRVPVAPTEVIRFADVVVDEGSHRVYRAGVPLDLSLTLYSLLRYFMLNPNQILSKEELFGAVWGGDDRHDRPHLGSGFLHDNSVQVSVSRLRKLLGRHGPPLIHTLRHRGYILQGPTT